LFQFGRKSLSSRSPVLVQEAARPWLFPGDGGGAAAVPPNAGAGAQLASLVAAPYPSKRPHPTWPTLATPLTGGMLLMADFVHGRKEEEDMRVSHVIYC
jgi:hypothetical protein